MELFILESVIVSLHVAKKMLRRGREVGHTSQEEVKKHERLDMHLSADLDKYAGRFKELQMLCGVVLLRNERSRKST